MEVGITLVAHYNQFLSEVDFVDKNTYLAIYQMLLKLISK